MTAAVTIMFLASGAAVQTAGPEIPLEQQVENLEARGMVNDAGIGGATRGEVWTSGRIVAAKYFENQPDAPPVVIQSQPPTELIYPVFAEGNKLVGRIK